MFALFLAAFFSWLLLRSLIPQLCRHLLDQPNARSSHCLPTPRGGGIVFVVVSSAASWVSLFNSQVLTFAALPLVAVPLAIVGLIDDRHNLPASWRYGAQLLTAAALLFFSPLVQELALTILYLNSFLFLVIPLLFVSITAIINFTNFMDGLDGLLAGCMAVAIIALAIKLSAPWTIWALVGALLGFLLWNWSPAKVFMGDVGSTFLGAVFSGLVLHASSWPEALGMLLVATPLLGDSCLCVLRRLLAGQHVFQAHRLHLFQRLHQAGWTHARVSSFYIAATAILAIALLAGGWLWVLGLAVAELLVGFWLDQRVAVTFSAASSPGSQSPIPQVR